ncbi:hypothetical protein [Rugamonas rubra]|uniref:Uncharacterized protein n=1 Tax=Rugamonas rubra TaxID=758825 RepID=A0A1I4SIF1_9BURK|nr:hypothetical protein [Rugamonas rubra]SFM64063.1 hypothetical protein SAMN02982985_04788 [Rugamonas rubra]
MQSNFLQDLQAQADPDRFLAMMQVYQTAARVPLPPRAGPGLHLTDIPLNRGMLAVVGAMRKHRDAPAALRATLSRLMHVDEIFEAREYFARYIRPGTDGDDGVEVADALLKAVAVARIELHGEHARFDLADVLAHARRFEAAEDTESVKSKGV